MSKRRGDAAVNHTTTKPNHEDEAVTVDRELVVKNLEETEALMGDADLMLKQLEQAKKVVEEQRVLIHDGHVSTTYIAANTQKLVRLTFQFKQTLAQRNKLYEEQGLLCKQLDDVDQAAKAA